MRGLGERRYLLNKNMPLCMDTHKFATHNPPEVPVFDYLKSGAKTVEGRPYSSKYHRVKVGDSIQFIQSYGFSNFRIH